MKLHNLQSIPSYKFGNITKLFPFTETMVPTCMAFSATRDENTRSSCGCVATSIVFD